MLHLQRARSQGCCMPSGGKFSSNGSAAARKGQHLCTPGRARLCRLPRHGGRKPRPLLIMVGESPAHSSMSTSVSNEQCSAAGRQAGAGGLYFQSLSQLDGSSPFTSSPSASPSSPCTPPTPSTPSGTWHPQLQTCEPTRVINVYEYGKPALYPGPDVFYHSID